VPFAISQTPVYSVSQSDAVTGDNPLPSFTACGVTCTDCRLPDPNGNVDIYTKDIYERPTGSGSGADAYFPALDIVSAQAGSDDTYFYFRVNLFDQDAGGSLPYRYAFAVDYDADPRPDTYILSEDPKGKVGTTFGNSGVFAWNDGDDNVGDGQITLPDGPSNTAAGYETLVFDQGTNSGSGGSDAVQARIDLVGGIPKSIEFAVKQEFLEALNGGPITALSFCAYTSKGGQSTSASTQLLHDEYEHEDAHADTDSDADSDATALRRLHARILEAAPPSRLLGGYRLFPESDDRERLRRSGHELRDDARQLDAAAGAGAQGRQDLLRRPRDPAACRGSRGPQRGPPRRGLPIEPGAGDLTGQRGPRERRSQDNARSGGDSGRVQQLRLLTSIVVSASRIDDPARLDRDEVPAERRTERILFRGEVRKRSRLAR
jgi:hypothetical protein